MPGSRGWSTAIAHLAQSHPPPTPDPLRHASARPGAGSRTPPKQPFLRRKTVPRYQAPLRDQIFVMHELLDVGAVYADIPAYAGLDADTLNQVVEAAGTF